MARATLSYVQLSSIDPNPYRDLKNYPYDQKKLNALIHSINDVGLWEGMIGREKGRRYELAFGHHRLEAARRANFSIVPLLLRPLTDEEMVAFMGRENMEDFNSDFLAQLNAWEAACKIIRRAAEQLPPKPIEIARLLGWTREDKRSTSNAMNLTASACHVALRLVEAGHLSRDDLANMSVSAAREIVERTHSRIEMVDKLGTMGKRPEAEIIQEKRHVGTAAKSVIKDVREGKLSTAHIRTEIDYRSVKSATAKGKASPLFAAFAKEVADGIHKMLVSDNVATRLAEMEKALSLVTMDEDRLALRRIDFALAEHGETTAKWRDRLLSPRGQKVVPFKLLKKEEG